MVFNNVEHFKGKVVGQLKGIILIEAKKAAINPINPHFIGK